MGLLFGRIKNWLNNERLKAADLNAEFNNILNNTSLINLSGYSTNVAQMQQQVDPGSQGSESLAQTTADEITRLRYAISRIIGGTYWYDTPLTSLDNVLVLLGTTSPPSNRIASGLKRASSNQPAFLVANGSNLNVTLKGSVTPFVFYVNSVQYTISTDVSILCTAGSASDTANVNDMTLAGLPSSKLNAESNQPSIIYNNASGNFGNPNGIYGAFQLTHSATAEYFIGYVTNADISKGFRGYFFDSASAPVPRLPITNADALLQLSLNWIFATTSGTLDKTTNNPHCSFTQPSSPASGDYWFDLNTKLWKKFNGSTFAASNATLVGLAICNSTACVASRSFDFYAPYDATWTGAVEILDNNNARTNQKGAVVNVAGTIYRYDQDFIKWTKPTNLDTGVTDGASKTFYLYVKDTGDISLSDITPYDRSEDLRGYYHPYNPWRCLGTVTNDASSHFLTITQGPNFTDRVGQQMSSLGANAIGSSMTSTGANVIGSVMTSTGANAVAIARTRSTGASVGLGGIATSNSSASFSTGSTTYVNVTDGAANLTATVITSGRPVFIALVPIGISANSYVEATNGGGGNSLGLALYQNGTGFAFFEIGGAQDNPTLGIRVSPSSFFTVTTPATGTYAYTVKIASINATGCTVKVINCALVAYEL